MTIADDWEPPKEYEFARAWRNVLNGALIALGVTGWLVHGEVLPQHPWLLAGVMCALTVVIEVWTLIAGAQWSRALSREGGRDVARFWFVAMVGGALWTWFAVAHALPVVSGGSTNPLTLLPAYLAFAFMCGQVLFAPWALDFNERAPPKHPKPAPKPPRNEQTERPVPPRRAPNARPSLSVVGGIRDGALALLLAQAQYKPRSPALFERAALIARENPGLSQEEIAERAGAPRATVGNWMRAVPEAFAQAA